jgi:predicted metal-dependent hydrolase
MPKLEDGRLVVGGPAEGFSARVERFLKRLALETLSRETAEAAVRAGIAPAAVSVGDASTRWGSCSSARRIRYSWRLILAPAKARRFVIAHEVAHLKELNHGARFKQIERELFGDDVAEARALLRAWGPRLKRIGLRH